MKKVALTGAAGQLGTVLRKGLLERGVNLRSAAGSKPLEPLVAGEDVMHGDLRDPAVVDRLLDGVDVLIHMAGTSVERALPEIIENNLRG
ncbi:MAG TPA: NAD-dependent epimerase/dehydratase family protein, partial [Paraburkholderia sp.]|nr:NAD-dependent epimerase/dehydratase family protein [Paraburkholderia sp.]